MRPRRSRVARADARSRASGRQLTRGAVALVLLRALTPYLVLTTALTPLQKLIGPDLGLGPRALQVTAGMANAAYAFGCGARPRSSRRTDGAGGVLVPDAALFVWLGAGGVGPGAGGVVAGPHPGLPPG